MRNKRAIAALLTLTAAASFSLAASALPAHPPGTICLTPQFWCWAIYPGPVGNRCACPTNSGWYQGVLV